MGSITPLLLACLLFLFVCWRRQRQRQTTVDTPLPDTLGLETELSQNEPLQVSIGATMPPATPPTVASPTPRFLLLQRKRYRWLNPVHAATNFRKFWPSEGGITLLISNCSACIGQTADNVFTAKSTTPATTSIISSSTSELLPLKCQPTKKAPTEDHDFEDLSSVNNRVSRGLYN